MLWPDSTSRTASCLNSSVYRARVAFLICIPFADSQLRDTFRGGKIIPTSENPDMGHRPSRGKVAGDVEDEVGGVGGVGVDLAVVRRHDRHVRGDGSVQGIQGRDEGL